jgi:hypothetical protein
VNQGLVTAVLFTGLGIAGSAAPAHIGMRLLAHRQQLDRQLPFAPGTEDNFFAYSWWLMRFAHHSLDDAPLRSFGNIAGLMGWITLLGALGAALAISVRNF